ILRILCRNELLGHQVHAVANGCNEADVRQPEQPHQRFAIGAAIDVLEGYPVKGSEPAIDFARRLFEARANFIVGPDADAGWRRALRAGNGAAGLRVLLQQSGRGAKTLLQPLAVIEAVDTDDEAPSFEAVPGANNLGVVLRVFGK